MSEKKLIELHLHLDGSLRPETVWELSKEQGIAIPASSPEDVKFKMEVPGLQDPGGVPGAVRAASDGASESRRHRACDL